MSYQKKIKKHIVAEPIQYPYSKKNTCFKGAQTGAAIGSRFGVHGVIVGGICGFLVGIIIDEALED